MAQGPVKAANTPALVVPLLVIVAQGVTAAPASPSCATAQETSRPAPASIDKTNDFVDIFELSS
jgi:hypothetical protein